MELGESEERADEPESSVEVTDDEFDDLLQAVFTHAETARRIAQGEKDSLWMWKEAGQEGADQASIEIMEKLVEERTLTGKCTRGHANRAFFMRRWRFRRIDAYRRMTAPARVPRESDEAGTDAEMLPGRRPRTELVGLWNDPTAGAIHEPAGEIQAGPESLDPIIVELVPRVMDVLASRGSSEVPRRTKHTPQQREAMLFAMAVRNSLIDHLDAGQLDFLEKLPEQGEHWKRDLASRWRGQAPGTSHIDQSPVTRALIRGAEQIQLCMYLFTTLAPRHHVVADRGDMDHLLDVLDKPQGVRLPPTERLESAERKRLRVAGETCVPHQDHFVVDVETYLETMLGQDADKEEARGLGLAALHASEERFAALVPEQVSPPQFSCVLRCPTHTPNSNDRES